MCTAVHLRQCKGRQGFGAAMNRQVPFLPNRQCCFKLGKDSSPVSADSIEICVGEVQFQDFDSLS